MRGAFVRVLTELADHDRRIVLLTGDLGYMALEPFAERHPDRFFNVGVAEQNMIGVATGLAEAGFIPFAYSIVTFAALRPYEFIRNGPIQHSLPVRIVGVGGGVEYGNNGLSHYGLEDVGVMRLQPALTVVAPADHAQTFTSVRETWNLPGPVYYRLGKDDRATVDGLDGRFALGRVQLIGEGTRLLLIAMGSIANEAVAAAAQLTALGLPATVAVVSSFNPSPLEDLGRLLRRFPLAITVEAHYLSGGVGSLAAELIAEQGLPCRLVRCGFGDIPGGVSGSREFLHHRNGLSATALVERAMSEVTA